MVNHASKGALRTTTGINIVFGIWLFLSPWFYGVLGSSAWNSWIFGALITIFAASRYGRPSGGRSLSFWNMLFGAWVFFSPWVYGYVANAGRTTNNLVVGGIVFFLGAYGAVSIARANQPPHAHT